MNKSVTEIDLRDNLFDVHVGLEFARMLLSSKIRHIDISENGFPSDVLASIEAAMSFSPSVWSSQNLQDALAEVSRLCPMARVNLFDVPDYLNATARFWQDEASTKHIMAAFHAPIAALRHIGANRGPRPESVEYKPERLQLLARMYAPFAVGAKGISLPPGRISIHGLFVLNLTPFCAKIAATVVAPLSGCLVPFPGINTPCTDMSGSSEVFLEVSSPGDVPDYMPQLRHWNARIALRVGEQRYVLDGSGGTDSGQLRAMFSIKDYPSTHNLVHEGRRACMLTLAWAQPARLSGVHLGELTERWEEYQKNPFPSQVELPKGHEPNMYHAVTSWIKPETGPTQSSFAALCDSGPVAVFVSHWWGSPLKQTLEALKRHAEGGEVNQRIWICSVANNQWRVAEELGDDIDISPFRQALDCSTCRCMALMLDTDGAPLKRYWCLYEIMTVMRLRQEGRSMELDLCSPEGVINRGSVRPEVGLKLAGMVAQIDVAAAECWRTEDKRMITDAINHHLGGFERMNEKIREFVADGLHIMYEGLTDQFNETTTMLGVGRSFGSGASPFARGMRPASPESPTEDIVARLMAELAEKDVEIERLKKDNQSFKLENGRLISELRTSKSVAKWVGAKRKLLGDKEPSRSP